MKCSGTSGPSSRTIHSLIASISSGESFFPGMSSVVISNQTSVSLLEIDERVEHRLQPRAAELHVELVGEALEVDVRRVHLRVELAPRLGADVARGDGDRLDAELAARVGGVHRILGEDHRIVVGEGDAPRTRRPRRLARSPPAWRRPSGVSISRDFEMSQFWQNLHARLQPAVPNDSTLEPG